MVAPKKTREIVYACGVCKRVVGRDNLVVRKVQFKDMGQHGRVRKSKVTTWLCMIPQEDGTKCCAELDPVWDAPPYAGTPGMADVELAHENAVEEVPDDA